jgi:hypothetical protein
MDFIYLQQINKYYTVLPPYFKKNKTFFIECCITLTKTHVNDLNGIKIVLNAVFIRYIVKKTTFLSEKHFTE